jgi:Holliday junction resolvasome RuvABC DNA-binding subunit
MQTYIIGKVVEINKNNIVLENNYHGYKIYVPRVFDYDLGKISKVFIYELNSVIHNGNRFTTEWFGFRNQEDLELFKDICIRHNHPAKYVTSIIMNNCDTSEIIRYIRECDSKGLAEACGCTTKVANNICLDLHDIYLLKTQETEFESNLNKALTALGYTTEEIS